MLSVNRPWGSYEVIQTQPNFQIKKISVNPGNRLSLQSHKYRSEHWFILSGSGQVQIDEQIIVIGAQESVFIPVGAKHRVKALGENKLEFIEIQTGSTFDEDDIVRYEDDFGRV